VISLSPEPTVVPSRSYYSSTTLEDEHVFLKVFIVRHFGSVGATSIIWELGSKQLPKGQYLAFGCLSSREKLGGDLKRALRNRGSGAGTKKKLSSLLLKNHPRRCDSHIAWILIIFRKSGK
jgi:hypothetical protein